LSVSANTRVAAPYAAPAWLPGGHAQTIYPYFFVPLPKVSYRRERWEWVDGDFVDADFLENATGKATMALLDATPLVVLFHGLEGDSRSHYSLSLMAAVRDLGWRGVVVHFRGCSGSPNRLPRAYHAGDAAEIDRVLRRLRADFPLAPIGAVGVSLGGNALLKWLGEQGAAAQAAVNAAVAISAPVDLAAAGEALARGFNLFYTRHFLRSLKRKAAIKLDQYPGLFDWSRVAAAPTLYHFDNLVTAPLHGFNDTETYWREASSKPHLKTIALPTLLVNARNDPFMPVSALPSSRQVSASVTLEFAQQGGHVGFVGGAFPGTLSWLPGRTLEFFRAILNP